MNKSKPILERYTEAGQVMSKKLHGHPFVVPVVTFLTLFIISSAAFINMGGRTIGASDSRVVQVIVDGQQQTVPTRAATVGELLRRLEIEINEGDEVQPAQDTEIIEDNTKVVVEHARPVTIIDEGKKVLTLAPRAEPQVVVAKAGLTVYPEDKVEIDRSEDILRDGLGERIIIDRATAVNINLYGTPVPVRTHAKTVGEALAEKDIRTSEGDTIQPAPETLISPHTQIFIVSRGKRIESKEEPIPAPIENVEDPNLARGTTQVRNPGTPGRKVVTYEIEMQNNRETGRRVIQEVIASQPIKRVVAKGTKAAVAMISSNPSANVELGRKIANEMGVGGEFTCLYNLFERESKWNHLARNRSSGAYGIPQALPGSKMGPGWETDPAVQIRWGINYVKSRYGGPCGAWSFWQLHHWY